MIAWSYDFYWDFAEYFQLMVCEGIGTVLEPWNALYVEPEQPLIICRMIKRDMWQVAREHW
jgi:hypothetical protein